MISIILYGRNDTHGYNLPKRAAISLNCIAEVLTHPDDEILFVDYNTPNDYPTFIEAIRDTLTERCRRLLRVFRLRPAVHERLRHRTHLSVLESVSRNVALRRSNPANRWVLSTNSDMILMCRQPGRSLSDVAAALPDGFYQLPRFEIAESLWESLDRSAPARTIETVRRWGTALHINEVVHTNPTARYDGIGDFQLALRDDLIAIDGFHEGMLIGWNVDMNLCRRLSMLRGATDSLLEEVFAYHCDHTRQPTVTLGANAPKNDPAIYIDGVTAPDLPEQRRSWGLAGEAVEEFRGDDTPADRFVASLSGVLPGAGVPFTEAYNDHTARFAVAYPPEHCLSYFADHLSTLPATATIAYAGVNQRTLDLFVRTWRAMGGDGKVLLVGGAGDGAEGAAGLWSATLDEASAQADLMVFDFGFNDDVAEEESVPGSMPSRVRAALGRVRASFIGLAARERRRLRVTPGSGRKFVALHAVNTFVDPMVRFELQFTWTPYSTRTRYGYVRREWSLLPVDETPDSLGAFLAARLGRIHPIDANETAILRGDLRRLGDAPVPAALEPWRFTAPLAAALEWPGLAAEFPTVAARLTEMRAVVAQGRPSAALRPLLATDHATAAGRSQAVPSDRAVRPVLSKLCSVHDWESETWYVWANRLTLEGLQSRAGTYAYFKRSRGVWERAQILHGLSALGALEPSSRLAVVSQAVDGLYLFLAGFVEHVSVIDASGDGGGGNGAAEGLDPWLTAKKRLIWADGIVVHHGGPDDPALADSSWDAIILPQNTIQDGPGIVHWLAWADRHLAPGGLLAYAAEVRLTAKPVGPAHACALGRDEAEHLARLVEGHTGLRVAGPFDWSLDDETLDRVAQAGTDDLERPHVVRRHGSELTCPSVWVWRKDAVSPSGAWSRVADDFGLTKA